MVPKVMVIMGVAPNGVVAACVAQAPPHPENAGAGAARGGSGLLDVPVAVR